MFAIRRNSFSAFTPAILPAFALTAVLGATAIAPLPAMAQSAANQENPVAAYVNGEEIRRNDVLAIIEELMPQLQGQANPDQIFTIALNEIILRRLTAAEGRKAGLQDDEQVRRRIKAATEKAVGDAWVRNQVRERVSDEMLRERYEEVKAQLGSDEEVKARHILVETEEEAKALIDQLESDADFAALAQEHSTGPSGPNGGDLGWFPKDQMVPEFADAAFALPAGEFTRTPVNTQFGWHVILVEDRRQREAPPFEQVRSQIFNSLAQGMVQEIVAELRETAEVDTSPLENYPGIQGGN